MSKTEEKAMVAVEMFLATMGDMTLEEALGNVELDAQAYGWDRLTVRTLAHKVRTHFAGKR